MHVVMIVPVPGLADGVRATIDRWPTVHRCARAAMRSAPGWQVTVMAPTTGPAETVDIDGVHHRTIHAPGRPQARLAGAAARCRADLLHVHGLVHGPLVVALSAATAGRVPIVTQHHGEPLPDGRARRWMRHTRPLVAGHLFTGGEAQALPWRSAGLLGRDPVYDVPESSSHLDRPPGRSRAAARAALGLGDAPLVLWVGRSTAGKDPSTALEIAERLQADGADHRLVMLATDEHSRRELFGMVERSGLQTQVEVRGPMPHGEMTDWYEAADVLLSTSHHEGSGYAVIEAMGAGCPVVAREIAPLRSLCGDAARFFAPGEVARAAALVRGPLPTRQEVAAEFEARASWARVGHALVAAWTAPIDRRRAA